MYVHGELLFPDYVAIALLAITFGFLFSITAYSLVLTLDFGLKLRKVVGKLGKSIRLGRSIPFKQPRAFFDLLRVQGLKL